MESVKGPTVELVAFDKLMLRAALVSWPRVV